MSRVGLVTTFRFVDFSDEEEGQAGVERCWSVLSSFLLFHLAKGIDHVFLYADADGGGNQFYLDRVAKEFSSSQVSVDVRSESQRKRQEAKCRLWDELAPFSSTEVPARQSLNAEDAMQKAGDMGLDWLLHLDIDELFFTAEPSVKPHFDRLRELGVEQMTYANHEAVPCREHVKDYFREVELFRINHLLLPLSGVVGECARFWRRRTSHGQYMLAYDNGKAAVRVLPEKRIVPQSVHRWTTLRRLDLRDNPEDVSPKREERGEGVAIEDTKTHTSTSSLQDFEGREANDQGRTASTRSDKLVNRTAMADPRELRFDEILECEDPCVLHYPSCGLDWLRDKYRLLGGFPSSWFGGKLLIQPCFHLDARDTINGSPDDSRGKSAEQDAARDPARELYHREVILHPEEHAEEIDRQLDHGVIRVFSEPASVIEKALRAHRSRALGSPVTPASLTSTDASRLGSDESGGKRVVLQQASPERATNASSLTGRTASLNPEVTSIAARGGQSATLTGENTTETTALVTGFDNNWILAACAREFL